MYHSLVDNPLFLHNIVYKMVIDLVDVDKISVVVVDIHQDMTRDKR